ncbi:MAG: glycosyltransferase [Eubacterium sp.]|nr:glycosyltransferase [Eubacterium sp.]
MKTNKPLVSICIPNYNYESTIAASIESALNQTYENVEIIVLDNCSTDRSFEIAKKYRKKGVRVVRNRKNLGAPSHNKLILMARGTYIQILHSDDILEPTYIEECVKVMEEHENVAVVCTERQEIDAQGNEIKMPPPFYNCSCIIPKERQQAVMIMASYFVPSQTFIRMSTLEQTGLYEIDVTYFMDWWLLYKCCRVGDLAVINKPLMRYRIWSSSDSSYMTLHMIMPMAGFLNRMCILKQGIEDQNTFLTERKDLFLNKHADLTVKWGITVIRGGHLDVGRKYLYLAQAFDEEIVNSPLYQAVDEFLNQEHPVGEKIDDFLKERDLVGVRNRSYDPPEGSIVLNI